MQTQAQIVSLHAMLGIIFLEVPVSSACLVSTRLGMSIAVAHALTHLPLDTTHLVEPQAQIVSMLAMTGIIFLAVPALSARLVSILL